MELNIWAYGASSIETRHLAKNFNFLFISKIYSTISIRCSSVISLIFQKIARCRVSIDEALYNANSISKLSNSQNYFSKNIIKMINFSGNNQNNISEVNVLTIYETEIEKSGQK